MRRRVVQEVGVLLTAAGAARVLGFASRVLLARVIGAEGLGLLQMAYPVYLVALTASSLGLQVGVAQQVAAATGGQDDLAAVRTCRAGLLIGIGSGALACVGLLALAPWIARALLHDPRAAAPLAVLAWALPPTVIAGVYRGYWQGMRHMGRVGLAQICDAGFRLLGALIWLAWLPHFNLVLAVSFAAGLTVLGELAGLAVVAFRPATPKRGGAADANIGPRLLQVSLPVAASRVVGSLGMAADAALIPAGLAAIGGADMAATQFGQLVGMALPVISLPLVVLQPVATVAVPAVSRAAAMSDRRAVARRAGAVAATATLLALTTSLVVAAFARPLAILVYRAPDLGPVLALCAALPPGIFLSQAATAILTGLGRSAAALSCQLAGTALRIVLLVILVPRLGLGGAAAALAASAAFTATIGWLTAVAAIRAI